MLPFALLSDCHEWPAASISACLRRWLRGCFRSDFNTKHDAGQATSVVLQLFGITRPSLPGSVTRAQ